VTTCRITIEETHVKLVVASEVMGAILSVDFTTFLRAGSIDLLILVVFG